jgi:predicted transcriptional regulator
MMKVVIRTDDVDGFFERAKDAARRADQGHDFDGKVTLSFEGAKQIVADLLVPGRQQMIEVKNVPKDVQ